VTEEIDMAYPNLERLEAFVEHGLRRSRSLADAEAGALLRVNAQALRRHLAALDRWAAEDGERPCPPHLQGLTAFDLADAADRLEAEAGRRHAGPDDAMAEA
jgi:hypothetical protein